MRELVAAMALAVAAPAPASAPEAPRPRPSARTSRSTPPSLTAGALATELREASRRRVEQLAEIQRERARLEQLAAEVAVARRELAREAARLEERASRVEEQVASERPPRAPRGDAPGAPEPPEPVPGDARVQALARTLKGMKPDQAAALVARLEKPLAVLVLTRLRPAEAAGVLGKMPSAGAAELFTLMARHGEFPR